MIMYGIHRQLKEISVIRKGLLVFSTGKTLHTPSLSNQPPLIIHCFIVVTRLFNGTVITMITSALIQNLSLLNIKHYTPT